MELFRQTENGEWIGPTKALISRSACLRNLRAVWNVTARFREDDANNSTTLCYREKGKETEVVTLTGLKETRPMMILNWYYNRNGHTLALKDGQVIVKKKEVANEKND
jgi:hypothetical protein